MSRVRTLRGKASDTTPVRLVIDDGNFNHAFRVIEFKVLVSDPRSDGYGSWATLSLSEDSAGIWDLSDNGQIGWAGMDITDTDAPAPLMSLIDPEHVVVRDLWIYGDSNVGTEFQYFVRLQKVDISDDQAILALIKERSQNVN